MQKDRLNALLVIGSSGGHPHGVAATQLWDELMGKLVARKPRRKVMAHVAERLRPLWSAERAVSDRVESLRKRQRRRMKVI